jgi:hypothetical protein
MTEDQLRALVREEIARALRRDPAAPPESGLSPAGHGASHLLFALAPLRDDGACVIEPAVACTHCGYCRSLGH